MSAHVAHLDSPRRPVRSAAASGEVFHEAGQALTQVALVAVLAVALGLTVQAGMLALFLAFGGQLSAPAAAAVEFARGVSWSVLVCSGVVVATLVMRARPLVGGALSFCVAPIAVALAKAAQTALAGWLEVAEGQAALSLGLVSAVRALEYGLLGWLLGHAILKGRERLWAYVAAGGAVAVVFGAGIAALTAVSAEAAGAPLTTAKLAATLFNEFASPIGCSMVIWGGRVVARRLIVIGG